MQLVGCAQQQGRGARTKLCTLAHFRATRSLKGIQGIGCTVALHARSSATNCCVLSLSPPPQRQYKQQKNAAEYGTYDTGSCRPDRHTRGDRSRIGATGKIVLVGKCIMLWGVAYWLVLYLRGARHIQAQQMPPVQVHTPNTLSQQYLPAMLEYSPHACTCREAHNPTKELPV